jgi:ubiquinone/menaquinone biosynthesis C-methylase UbiE
MTHDKQTLSVKDFFDSRAESYHRVSRWATDEKLNSKTDAFLYGLSGRVALDLGAGTGTLISRLRCFETKIALDISSKMLSQIEDASIQKIVGDVHQLELPDGYADLIICRQALHYCDLAVAFQNIMRVLSPEGWLHIVQVVDFENVPESWDQEWASFRNVGDRRHQRRSELEKCYFDSSLRVIKSEYLQLRDEYLWDDFFVKNNVSKDREKEVKKFFEMTPRDVAEEIDLQIDGDGIAYNRVFGFWLLQKQ